MLMYRVPVQDIITLPLGRRSSAAAGSPGPGIPRSPTGAAALSQPDPSILVPAVTVRLARGFSFVAGESVC
jgi:hypothetical protein